MDPLRLHVVSWNILAPVYMKCQYYASTQCSQLAIRRRRPKIDRLLAWMKADVYLLQEVTESEFQRLERAHPAYQWFFQPHAFDYWKESPAHEWNGNVVGVRRSLQFQHLRPQALRLSRGNRGLLVKAQTAAGWPLALVSLHLDDTSDVCRSAQLDRLFRLLPKRTVLILGGDWNDEFGTALPQIRQRGFHTSPSQPTYFEERPLALDYIAAGPRDRIAQAFWYVPPSHRADIVPRYGSDHLPVTGLLTVAAPSGSARWRRSHKSSSPKP